MKLKNMSNLPSFKKASIVALTLSSAFVLSACGSGGSSNSSPTAPVPAPNNPPAIEQSNQLIKLNQVGFLPSDKKMAAVPATTATSFELVDSSNNSVAMSGTLSSANMWAVAGESVKIADFSSVSEAGQYKLRVPGFADSATITIGADVFLSLHDATLKAYYFNRASTALSEAYAGEWSRPSGHPDTDVKIHSSAASASRPEGASISAPKGWYDAGDYNKYIVNSGISTYTLLASYEQFSDFYQDRDVNIPESGNAVPDILDEIKWNLDWMLDMQDPADGGVYHKLTTLDFSGTIMPHEGTEQRYVVTKGTGAALNFAAVMATASRIYAQFPEFSEEAATYQSAAISAWNWALANPNIQFVNPNSVSTGEYGDNSLNGEFTWAATELFLLTNESQYLNAYKQYFAEASVPNWQDTSGIGYISLMQKGESVLSDSDFQEAKSRLLGLADYIVSQHQASAYSVAMASDDFVWGSNGVALNKAMVLMQAFQTSNDKKYRDAATSLVDYVLGRNPTDYSFVTGFGAKTPMDIHHRPSYADDVVLPVPGFVAGGPQPGQQDNCNYPSDLAAKSYLDDWCSYSTNEVTINWNAPLVYVLAALHNTQD